LLARTLKVLGSSPGYVRGFSVPKITVQIGHRTAERPIS